MKAQQRLFARYAQHLPPGTLRWIGLRPKHRAAMLSVANCLALKELGLEGDHRSSKTPGSGRQVTLISKEFIQQIAQHRQLSHLDPAMLRRNLVIEGININALRHQQFTIGEVLFEATALCHPCSRMEQALGKGGVAAMLGYGGLCCKILSSGTIKVGDSLKVIVAQPELF
ncbi:MOSC domain-containing protein [Dasania marina]|uniref:MOSC domain-containing protein n=1 Tax=Dasania marina TaxID=471499 RepID=UPI00037779C3|nr:MOSC domain-containing protein [Dasania marina]